MPSVHLIYARSRSPASWLIRHWPDSAPAQWSHAGVLMPPALGMDEGWNVWEARFGHSLGPTPVEDFRARYSHTETVAYEVPDADAGRAWLESQRGRRYATGTVVGRMLGLRGGESSADHCSEVVEGYLAACGLRRWRGGNHLVTPNVSFNNLHGVAA